MTKTKASARAKAKAMEKRKKAAQAAAATSDPGKFDPGAEIKRGPNAYAGTKNFTGAKAGASRAR